MRKQNKYRAEVAYLKHREETEKMELDLEALEEKLAEADKKGDDRRAETVREQIKELREQIAKHTKVRTGG